MYKEILMNNEKIQVEIFKPMIINEAREYIKRLQVNYLIDYSKIEKEKINDKQFVLKYERENTLY